MQTRLKNMHIKNLALDFSSNIDLGYWLSRHVFCLLSWVISPRNETQCTEKWNYSTWIIDPVCNVTAGCGFRFAAGEDGPLAATKPRYQQGLRVLKGPFTPEYAHFHIIPKIHSLAFYHPDIIGAVLRIF